MRLTTESIQQALLILMRNKPFGDITVSEVIRRAGVSRSAFCRHYASKKDILLIPLQKATQEIYAYSEPGMLDGWRRLFRTVADNSGMIRVFLEAGLEQEMLRTADGMLPHDDRAAVLQAMWDGLIFNTIIEWVRRGQPLGVEEMARLCFSCTLGLMRAQEAPYPADDKPPERRHSRTARHI